MGSIKPDSTTIEEQKINQSNKSTHYKSKPSITPDFFANTDKIDQLRARISAVSSSSSLPGAKVMG